MARGPTLPMYKRMMFILLVIIFVGFFPLFWQLIKIQIINYETYQRKAINQQTRDIQIAPRRGTIYDRNMKPLAISASAYMVIISPKSIDSDADREILAQGLSDILSLDKEKVMASAQKNSFYEVVARRIENAQADAVREFIKENKLGAAISIAEDPKRYYPFNNFASHILGFTGTDNQGLAGLEVHFDNYLKGVPGRIITARNAQGTDMPFDYEKFIEPQDGSDLVLTIDETVQHFLEKNLETAIIENNVQNRAAGIIMNVKTGEILAMAVKPDFNLNEPFTISDPKLLESLKGLTGDALSAKTSETLNEMWRNKILTEQYEPGSTFKTFTAAMAIEENLVNDKETFVCNGFRKVGGRTIHCAKVTGHGVQTFLEGIENSCNPVFMDIGARVGSTNFFKYVTAFGFRDKTNINLPGEGEGIFFNSPADMKPVELAVSSFGQTFKITPLQLITATAAVANGGKLLQPSIVKEIIDPNKEVVESFKPTVIRQVVSEATSKKLSLMLESVVQNGSGRNAYIKGYRIAGKTGTSEKIDIRNTEGGTSKVISSFIGFAPADDPQIICLILLDEPVVPIKYGSVIVAPVVANVFRDVLPALGIEPQFTEEERSQMDVKVPTLTALTTVDASKKLKDLKLNVKIVGGEGTVEYQLPLPGQNIPNTGTVILYTNNQKPEEKVTVPECVGKTAETANSLLVNAGLNIKIIGKDVYGAGVTAYSQSPVAGSEVTPGTVVSVEFRVVDNINDD